MALLLCYISLSNTKEDFLMDHFILSQRMKDTIDMLAYLGIERAESSERVDLRTTKYRFSYHQRWTPKTEDIISQFVAQTEKGFSPSAAADLTQYLKSAGTLAVEQTAESEHLKMKHARLIFFSITMAALLIIYFFAQTDMVPGAFLLAGAALIIGGAIVMITNKVRFPDVREHLLNDTFTLEDCRTVYEKLAGKEKLKTFTYYGAVGMIVLSLIIMTIPIISAKNKIKNDYRQLTQNFDEEKTVFDQMIEEGKFEEALDLAKEKQESAKELEEKAAVGDELSQSYLSEYERILRTYFCGFWIGESDNPEYPYSVIYITENNEMYWSYAYSIPPSSIEEQLAIVDQYGEDYRFSVGRIEFNKPLREMSMYSGTTLTSDKLVIRMVSDDIARIKDINLSSERNFTRLK